MDGVNVELINNLWRFVCSPRGFAATLGFLVAIFLIIRWMIHDRRH